MKYLAVLVVAVTTAGGLGVTVGYAKQAIQPAAASGPEMNFLRWEEGVWDATIQMVPGPGKPAQTLEGVQTDSLRCCGQWLVTDLAVQGSPYEGHGILGWDPKAKKLVGVWVDSQQNWLGIAEGEVDSSGETLTLRIKSRDPRTNKAAYSRWVTRRIDQNTRLLEIFLPMPEGQEGPAVTIRSKRRSSKT